VDDERRSSSSLGLACREEKSAEQLSRRIELELDNMELDNIAQARQQQTQDARG
jgi:hypothetical protein